MNNDALDAEEDDNDNNDTNYQNLQLNDCQRFVYFSISRKLYLDFVAYIPDNDNNCASIIASLQGKTNVTL